jgi:hypothetical protein
LEVPHLLSKQLEVPHLLSKQLEVPHLLSKQLEVPHLLSKQLEVPHLSARSRVVSCRADPSCAKVNTVVLRWGWRSPTFPRACKNASFTAS